MPSFLPAAMLGLARIGSESLSSSSFSSFCGCWPFFFFSSRRSARVSSCWGCAAEGPSSASSSEDSSSSSSSSSSLSSSMSLSRRALPRSDVSGRVAHGCDPYHLSLATAVPFSSSSRCLLPNGKRDQRSGQKEKDRARRGLT